MSAIGEVFDATPATRSRPVRGIWLSGALLLAVAGLAVWQNRPHPTAMAAQPVSTPAAVPANATLAAVGKPLAAPMADLSGVLPQLPRSEDAAVRLLAAAWDVQVGDVSPVCAALSRQNLPCFRTRGAGLDLLRQLDRPAVLVLNVGGRPAYAVLRHLDAGSATLEVDGQPRRVDIGALAGIWRGDLVTLWRDPDTTPEATDARLSRVLPGLPADLSRSERIARFQVAGGLPPDGRAGPLTAMRLNRASGLDEPRLLLHP